MSETANDFRLSRIQANGWNAARRMSLSDAQALDSAQIDALNPYLVPAERMRWVAGFMSMLDACER